MKTAEAIKILSQIEIIDDLLNDQISEYSLTEDEKTTLRDAKLEATQTLERKDATMTDKPEWDYEEGLKADGVIPSKKKGVSKYKKSLLAMVNVMDEGQAQRFHEWLLETIEEVGMSHPEYCLMNRPHSHSADCDCGMDELQANIQTALLKV